ncbi:hypothetical protein fh0823_26230 [Francisella halioticida]|uniref:Uncharacterized protein n=1 Tax=Francisella halioticida TaxID=549298 RepID=A0ABM6LXJ4_9GAMM|nr:hypothetical protein [Francisella halioticida]ASG67321.1 hypothetical protein CDV26_01970 [Francisella halioticida]BCD92484.1 hypothetical protein fh0823_26230 [Francisella halioticida]
MQYNYFHYPNDMLPAYGSVLYFAYRKLDNKKKEILYLLDQIKSQIISCTELYNNVEVANEKMNWWLKELNNLKNSKPISSPQLKKLVEIFDNNLLYNYLVGDISHSIDNSSTTERNFEDHISKNFLGIEILKANYLNNFSKTDEDTIKQLNINNEIVRHVFCMPKHFYNQISFNNKIASNMSDEDFKNITSQWLKSYKKQLLEKSLKPLDKIGSIHYKMLKKYLKNINNPFKETLEFSPLTLLFYSM